MSYIYLTYRNVPEEKLEEIIEEIKDAWWFIVQYLPEKHASSEIDDIDDYLRDLVQSCSVMLFVIGEDGITSQHYQQETLLGQRLQKDLVCLTLSEKYPVSSTQGVPTAWRTLGITTQARHHLYRTLGVHPPPRTTSTIGRQRIFYPDEVFCPHCRESLALDFSRDTAWTKDILAMRIDVPQSQRSASDKRLDKQEIGYMGYDFIICQKCKTVLGVSEGRMGGRY